MRRRTHKPARDSSEPGVSVQLRHLGRMYPMYPERHSHQREYGEPEICSQRVEYGEPERCSQRREYEEPERCSQRREYGEPEKCSQRREYEEPERCSQRREYGEPETCSHQREYREPERCSRRKEYGEPERCSRRREYGEPERCSRRREYGEPERCSRRREYGEPEICSRRKEYGEPERCSRRKEYGEPERCSWRKEYGEPERCSRRKEYGVSERCSQRREYEEPERCSQRREYGEPSSGQWNDSLKRDNGQAMAREPYSEYSSMRRTREGWEEYGTSSDMSYIMDPSSGDWSEDSLRGSGAPFSPDTDGDVDGDPVEPSVEDREVIEKRAVLAMQKIKRGAKDMPKTQTAYATAKGMSEQRKANNTTFNSNVADQSSRICLPLKRRVLDILSKDNPAKLKKQNKMRALELMISAPLENEEARPLRVKALMNQRRYPDNEEVVLNDKRHNQRPVHSLRTQEKDIAATGFQRFLNVLNEGVDINKLSKIVNNKNGLLIVGEELPQVWPTLPEGHVDSSSRSKSSPVEEKKVRLEDEQRYEQMQTLLEIVGLDLGVEELGQLTDRTNDRLYGKMGDLKRKEFKNEKGKEKKESEPSFKHLSTSSLPSDSASPSPLLNQHSNMTVEYSSSSNKVWDIERHRDRSETDWHRHSGTRDKDRGGEEDIVREMDRSERNRKGDGHRHSSTRERDKDIPVVRETNRSERNRDKDGDKDPEKDWDGGQERDRDRSGKDGQTQI
ncbi:uncharacterized protein LOC115178516 isoform X1 [Salmo trutta]|uniref:uncharacterized protein LOC115178516 isoform X1 n=1 Tax=Salmo trutta TaxID=8032 RepID=UPI0011319C2D|nr:uncharacterized protein LOC115178516 isoform X1 [Salmo trutta]